MFYCYVRSRKVECDSGLRDADWRFTLRHEDRFSGEDGRETAMSGKHTGSCLCEAVTFEIDGEFDKFFLCHCSRCRKFSGTAHASNLFCSQGEIVWLKGEDRVKPFEVPGTRFSKNFCADCGSPLPRQRGEGLMAPAGCLDTPVRIPPNAHIFYADRANWDEHLEDTVKFDQRPG